MRYICISCGAKGADGGGHTSQIGPYSYNCHMCNKHNVMWPEFQAVKYINTVAALREGHGKDDADRRAVASLQEQLNQQRKAMASASLVIESLNATLQLGLKIIDQVLPQAGSISIDVGAVNEFCMRARK